MYVCMCVCVCICVYVCMYACMYVYIMYVCTGWAKSRYAVYSIEYCNLCIPIFGPLCVYV